MQTHPLLQSLRTTGRLGLITDVDGTISPIVAQPEAAQVTPRARELLAALAKILPLVAVISGRAVSDVHQRVGLDGLVYVGNHGLERWHDGRVEPEPEAVQFRPAVEAAVRELSALKRELNAEGILIEDKGITLTLHYRNTPDPASLAQVLAPRVEAAAVRSGLRMFAGRMVFELRPPLEIDKGSAFRRLIEDYALDAAVYLGDDTTDVDALKMARTLRESGACYAIGVGVGSSDMPAAVGESADVLVDGVSGVEAFLDWLLNIRSASSS